MKSWMMPSILLGFALIIAFVIIFSDGDDTNSQSSCKNTSETVGEYSLCLALERCHDDFPDNSALNRDCLINAFRD